MPFSGVPQPFRRLSRGSRVLGLPRGSEYPNSKVLGPKIYTLNGFWTLKPYYLGTRTLRVRVKGLRV